MVQEGIGTYACIFVFLLIVLKNVSEVKKMSKTNMSLLTLTLYLSAIMAFVPIVLSTVVIFAIYRQIIFYILKVKHGSKFRGLVKGSDAAHTIDEPSNSITNVLVIIEYDHERYPEDFYETGIKLAKTFKNQYLSKIPKSQSKFLKYMGYSYMLFEDVTEDDFIRKMKIIDCQNKEMNKTEFMNLLSDCYNAPLPRNETIFWDIFLGTQPIKWKENVERKGIKYYPTLFRVHHCVADGVALLKLWVGAFADKQTVKLVYCEENQGSSCNSQHYHYSNGRIKDQNDKISVNSLTERLTMGLYILLVTPATIFVNFVLRAKDSNILHGPPLTGKEVLAMKAEESNEYFLKIKKIKHSIPGASFPEVLLVAFSASLKDYFQKNSLSRPEHITTIIPLISGSAELHHLIPGELNVSDIQFENSYSFVLLNLPIIVRNEDSSLLSRFNLLKEQMKILKNSVDLQFNYFLMSVICAILPQPLVRLLLSQSRCTAAVSILPGPGKLSFGNGVFPVQDYAFWIPHLKNIGVGFTAFTYDKRLQVGLGADKALIPNQDDAQTIVDGVFKNLDLLEKEVDCMVLNKNTTE